MGKREVCLVLLLSICACQVSYLLHREEVLKEDKSFTDIVHYFSPLYDTDSEGKKTIFDSVAESNYFIGAISGAAAPFSGLSGNLQSGTPPSQTKHDLTYQKRKLDKVDFTTVAFKNGATFSSKNIQVGLSLAVDSEKNFIEDIHKSKEKIKQKSFSFFFHEKINKIYFGESQKFFASSKLEKFDLDPVPTEWRLSLAQVTVGNQVAYNGQAVKARLDTTTAYTQIDKETWTSIQNSLQNYQIFTTGQKLVICKAIDSDVTIDFQFTGSKTLYHLKLSHLVRNNNPKNGYCEFLLQPLATEGAEWVLGTSFLSSVYTYFDQEEKAIWLSNKAEVDVEPIIIPSNWRIGLIISGVLLIVTALTILVSVIKPLPPIQPNLQKPVQKLNVVQQLVPGQQFIPVRPPVQFGQQPQQQLVYSQVQNNPGSNSQVRSGSPVRFTQQSVLRQGN